MGKLVSLGFVASLAMLAMGGVPPAAADTPACSLGPFGNGPFSGTCQALGCSAVGERLHVEATLVLLPGEAGAAAVSASCIDSNLSVSCVIPPTFAIDATLVVTCSDYSADLITSSAPTAVNCEMGGFLQGSGGSATGSCSTGEGEPCLPSVQETLEDASTRDDQAAKLCKVDWRKVIPWAAGTKFAIDGNLLKDGSGEVVSITENSVKLKWKLNMLSSVGIDWTIEITNRGGGKAAVKITDQFNQVLVNDANAKVAPVKDGATVTFKGDDGAKAYTFTPDGDKVKAAFKDTNPDAAGKYDLEKKPE